MLRGQFKRLACEKLSNFDLMQTSILNDTGVTGEQSFRFAHGNPLLEQGWLAPLSNFIV
jgi:hypothetical protein